MKAGFLPELIGRFNNIILMDDLNLESMSQILRKNVLPKFRKQLALDGIKLSLERNLIRNIAEAAMANGCGARGLDKEVLQAIQLGTYECLNTGATALHLRWSNGRVDWDASSPSGGLCEPQNQSISA